MKKHIFLIGIILGFSKLVLAQACFSPVRLESPSDMVQFGSMSTIGYSNAIFIVEKDYQLSTAICDKNNASVCGTVTDEKLVEVYSADGCSSSDFFYVDIIDTKFSFEYLKQCGKYSIKNISDPINWNKLKLEIEKYEAIEPEHTGSYLSHTPYFSLYELPSDYIDAYEYVITNLDNDNVEIIVSTIGDEIRIPEGNYAIELKLKEIADNLNDERIFFLNNILVEQTNNSACVLTGQMNALKNKINFYPNPVNSVLNLENLPIGQHLELINSFGTSVFNSTISSLKMSFETEHLPEGIYTLKIATQAFKFVKK